MNLTPTIVENNDKKAPGGPQGYGRAPGAFRVSVGPQGRAGLGYVKGSLKVVRFVRLG